MRSVALALALLLAAAIPAAAAEPLRVALVRPAQPDKVTREAATRLRAELLAAGFAVILVDAEPQNDAEPAEPPAPPPGTAAAVAILSTAHGPAADVSIPDRAAHTTLVQRVDTGTAAEPSKPADLAIRAVELLRAQLLEPAPSPPPPPKPKPAPEPPPAAPESLPAETESPSPAPPPHEPRALLERFTVELGLSAIYGLGDANARLAPTLSVGYGIDAGLAIRLTSIGPTGTDQGGLLEFAYGGGRWATVFAPVVALGVGVDHAHLDDTSSAIRPMLITDAWSAVASASLGAAARPNERAAIVVDAHALLLDPMPGSVIFQMPGMGHPQYLLAASLGILGGF